jgi:hypothetical protein
VLLGWAGMGSLPDRVAYTPPILSVSGPLPLVWSVASGHELFTHRPGSLYGWLVSVRRGRWKPEGTLGASRVWAQPVRVGAGCEVGWCTGVLPVHQPASSKRSVSGTLQSYFAAPWGFFAASRLLPPVFPWCARWAARWCGGACVVGRLGLEPRTPGLKVPHSAN